MRSGADGGACPTKAYVTIHWDRRLAAAFTTTAVPRQRVFRAATVTWRRHHMAAAVTGLIRLEMIKCLRTACGQRAPVPMMRVEAVIHVAMETRRAVEPRTYTDKYAGVKPIRPVVPIWSTVIRGVIEISIWANGCNPDIHAYRDLRMRGPDRTKCREYEGS